MIKKIFQTFLVIWNALSLARKVQLIILVGLSFLSSLAEIISLGAVVPFLMILTNPGNIYTLENIPFVGKSINFNSISELQFKLTAVFIITVAIAGFIRWLFLFYQTKVSYGIGIEISEKVYTRFLNQPYSFHTSINSSEMISNVIYKTDSIISKVIYPILTIINGVILFIGIFVSMLLVNVKIVLILIFLFCGYYLLVSILTKNALGRFGAKINQNQTNLIKLLQEGFGSIRDVILSSTQSIYVDDFIKAQRDLKNSQASVMIIGLSPRYLIETLGIIFIALAVFFQTRNGSNLDSAIPVIGVLVLGSQKLLPIFQQVFLSFTQIKSGSANVFDVLKALNLPFNKSTQKSESIIFNNSLSLNNIYFKYPSNNNYLLNNMSLTLLKGERLGIMGSSGSGKSTFLDVVMGLANPQYGDITIDEIKLTDQNRQAWQKNIAHVPQHIFLSDTTIMGNIAFGVPYEEIDIERVSFVANQASMSDFIDQLPNKLSTIVGERGVQLSGGQRQRIGIARALYKNAKIIIFDEATSALDNRTEMSILDSINLLSRDLTIIMVTHRTSTLSMCSRILKIENGNILFDGPYKSLLETTNFSL